MRQISSLSDFQQLLEQFEHPHLISGWRNTQDLLPLSQMA
ncbi:hypothetical protein JCM19233_518 [Vibrio astriarenae]|nr:hypothetical protein JCM19233_518 [Vibrio sp. C7]